MDRFVLTQETKCPKCKGKGAVRHAEWVKFYEAYPEWDRPIEGYEDEVKFNDAASRYFKTSKNVIPPPMIHCPDCGGHGVIRSECDLKDALKAIGE